MTHTCVTANTVTHVNIQLYEAMHTYRSSWGYVRLCEAVKRDTLLLCSYVRLCNRISTRFSRASKLFYVNEALLHAYACSKI